MKGLGWITLVFLIVDFCAVSFCLKSPAEQLAPYFMQEVQAVGYLEPLSMLEKEGRLSFVLDCQEVYVKGHKLNYREKLRIYSGRRQKFGKEQSLSIKVNRQPVAKAGIIKVTGQLQELRGFANPGSFNMQSYNWTHGLGGMVRNAEVEVLSTNPRCLDYFALANLELSKFVEQYAGDKAALLNGMVLGKGSGIASDTRESFSANGLSHLLSVSGTHLLLLASFIRLILARLGKGRNSVIVVLFLSTYACICGLKPPVLRALGMSTVLMWEDKRPAAKGRILCVLVIVMLLFNPVWILDLGFQLSFAAASGLLWLMPKLKQRLDKCLRIEPILQEGIAVTLAAQLATLPILVGNFYTISLIAIISNVLLVPVLELATILTLLGMLIGYLLAPLGGVLIQLAAWLTEQILVQALWLQKLPFSTLVVGSLPVVCAVIYYVLLFVWLDLPIFLVLNGKERRCVLMLGSAVILGCWFIRQYLPVPTTIYYLDVGQGDAAVVLSPERKIAVLDTGGLAGMDTGARILTPFIHSLGKAEVEVFVPSHGDRDHIGGSAGLTRNIKIKQLILPMEKLGKENYPLYRDLLQNASGTQLSLAKERLTLQLGGCVLRIVSPLSEKAEGNDASTLVELEDLDTGHRALFTGDMSTRREVQLQNLSPYTVLKVGHHGSKSSTSQDFLEQIQPKLAVVSCGYRNMYGHPHHSVIERLQSIGAKVVRTDLQGCIKVEFSAKGVTWQGHR